MIKKANLQALWNSAKHGVVSENDLVACENMLENAEAGDLHLAILTVGLLRNRSDRLVRVMEGYLHHGSLEAERYSAIRVLCSYWGLWSNYIPYLLKKLQPPAWESEYSVAEEAARLLAEYLRASPSDQSVWMALLSAYDDAVISGDREKEGAVYWAIFSALRGSKDTLNAQLAGRKNRDEQILSLARLQAEKG